MKVYFLKNLINIDIFNKLRKKDPIYLFKSGDCSRKGLSGAKSIESPSPTINPSDVTYDSVAKRWVISLFGNKHTKKKGPVNKSHLLILPKDIP